LQPFFWYLIRLLVVPLLQQSESESDSESLYGWQSVSMSWCRAHFMDVWPDIASFSRVWVWNVLCCPCGAPSLTRGRVCPCVSFVSESESLYGWQSVCLGVEPPLWTYDQILLPFQVFGSGICCSVSVERPLWREAGPVLFKSESESLYGWQSVSMSWCRAHSGTSDQILLLVGRLLFESCLESVRVTLRLTVSQCVLASSPLYGRLTRYCFLFKLKFKINTRRS
jgi:hypothetical protein